MAYKFQVGNAIMSGALKQEGDLDIEDAGSLKMNGVTIITDAGGIQNALTISGSSTLAGLDLLLAPGKTIGVVGDADLMTLTANTVTVAGAVSGSGIGSFGSMILNGALNLQSAGVLSAGAVAGATTIVASGKITGNEYATDGNEFTVSTAGVVVSPSGSFSQASLGKITGPGTFAVTTAGAATAASLNNSNGGITNAGAIGGGTTLALSGLASVASISMDDGSTLGPDSVPDLWTYSAAGDTTQKDGLFDFNIASHDGTNGLALGGVIVNASAPEINFNAGVAAGTVTANRTLVVNASKNIATLGTVGCGAITSTNASSFGSISSVGSVVSTSTVSGSGAASFGSMTLDGALALQSAGITAVGAIAGATTLTATGLGQFGSVSGSGVASFGGALEANSTVEFHKIDPDASYARAEDGLYYYDAGTGQLKATTNDALLNAWAGDGLSVVSNQLVAEAGSTTPSEFTPAVPGLSEGFNYATGSVDSFTAFLPSVTFGINAGDTVKIKVGALVSGKIITIKPSAATPLMTLDGGTEVLLESPYAAVTCVLAKSGSWLIL
jgi:hypothetical protein